MAEPTREEMLARHCDENDCACYEAAKTIAALRAELEEKTRAAARWTAFAGRVCLDRKDLRELLSDCLDSGLPADLDARVRAAIDAALEDPNV